MVEKTSFPLPPPVPEVFGQNIIGIYKWYSQNQQTFLSALDRADDQITLKYFPGWMLSAAKVGKMDGLFVEDWIYALCLPGCMCDIL